MSVHSLQNLSSSLVEVLPVAVVFSKPAFPSRESKEITPSALPEQAEEWIRIRATRVTPILRDIPGYEHGGLNE